MVISNEHKYVFIGIPYSGSTAISNELCLNYGGEPVLAKHANIQMLLDTGFDLSSYTVAAVIRNPLEMLTTHFYNMKNPPHGWFTDPKFFIENGGHLRKVDRRRCAVIQAGNMSFDEFIARYYRLPYDTFFTLNKPYLDYVIEFSDLSNSFRGFLEVCGIEPVRDLPLLNKSDNKATVVAEEQTIPACCVPFMYENRDLLKLDVPNPRFFYYLLYKLMKLARYVRWRHYDKTVPVNGYCSYYEMVERRKSSVASPPE